MSWKQVTLKLKPHSSALDTDNIFFVTLNGAEAAGETIHFALFSLFPPTFKNRPNGMRVDIAEVMQSFLTIFKVASLTVPVTFTDPGRNGTGFFPISWWK